MKRMIVLFLALLTAFPALASEGENVVALTNKQKASLIQIAKETIDMYVRTGKTPEIQESDPRLSLEEGAFVTIYKQGNLRGCIGNILGRGPLCLTVREMAVSAATRDPRFRPLSSNELSQIKVSVSVLSKPWRITDVNEIQMGVHGVIVSRGPFHSGVFLPKVAAETGWGRDQFLSVLCTQKAGLPADCWKDPKTIIEIFTAQEFSEDEVQ